MTCSVFRDSSSFIFTSIKTALTIHFKHTEFNCAFPCQAKGQTNRAGQLHRWFMSRWHSRSFSSRWLHLPSNPCESWGKVPESVDVNILSCRLFRGSTAVHQLQSQAQPYRFQTCTSCYCRPWRHTSRVQKSGQTSTRKKKKFPEVCVCHFTQVWLFCWHTSRLQAAAQDLSSFLIPWIFQSGCCHGPWCRAARWEQPAG